MKLGFLSDVHLNHASAESRAMFFKTLSQSPAEVFVIAGDIAVSNSVLLALKELEEAAQRPIYFVLGNHDFWGAKIELVQAGVQKQAEKSSYLRYLTRSTYIALDKPSTVIIGHDCWYDGGYGDAENSTLALNDWHFIKDFNEAQAMYVRKKTIELSKNLANVGVRYIHDQIKSAAKYANKVIVVTHAPPYRECNIYENKIGDNYSQPWFACKMLGEMLNAAADAYPNTTFISLSGHTHTAVKFQQRNNLTCYVAGAEYMYPRISQIIEV